MSPCGAGTLSSRVRIATNQVPAVGALPWGFNACLKIVRSKHLLGGLHGCESAAVSVTALSSFRSTMLELFGLRSFP